MRHILMDYARKRGSEKHGGHAIRVPLDDGVAGISLDAEKMLALNSAIERLKLIKPGVVQVVDLVCFGGLTQEEAAHVLECDVRTVKRRWNFAKGFLERELKTGQS